MEYGKYCWDLSQHVRTKDVAILDVLSESVNNAIRLLIGWFCLAKNQMPPMSIVVGYWMAGAFLMAMKRFAEYRMIGDSKLAGLYRKSFKKYTAELLLNSAFFYAMCSAFLMGIFLVQQRWIRHLGRYMEKIVKVKRK